MLLALALAAAAVAASCAKKKHITLYLPAEHSTFTLGLDFPLSATTGTKQDFSYVCGDTKSILVSLDVDSAATIAWDYRFLFDLNGKLWGCGGGSTQCPDGTTIAAAIKKPFRIAVEGIDVDAADYATSPTHNVICRGVADSTIGMGQIDIQTVPTPTPGPTPQGPIDDLTVTATVPMLRVGDVNGTYTTTGADEDGIIGGSLTPEQLRDVRTSTGGVAVFTQRVNSSNVPFFEFRPWVIGGVSVATHLRYPRGSASSVAFLDSAGTPALFIGGGSTPAGTEVERIEIYRSGEGETEEVPYPYISDPMVDARVFALPNHVEGGIPLPAIVMVGGCGGTLGNPTFSDKYTYFFPIAPVDLSACETVGGAALCRPGNGKAMGDLGHCGTPSGIVTTPAGPRIFVGPGYVYPNRNIGSTAYLFDPEAKTYSSTTISGSPPYLGRYGVTLSSSLLGIFTGFSSGGVQSPYWGYVRGDTGAYAQTVSSQPATAEASAIVNRLLDGRVLLVSENGAADPRTFEVFTPSGISDTSGAFSFMKRSLAGASCSQSTDPNCVRFTLTRHPTAAQILGSRTWLNGAVVYTGVDSGNASHSTALFVPAYDCDGSIAVRPSDQSVVSGVDFCDRGRAAEVLTDPGAPLPVN